MRCLLIIIENMTMLIVIENITKTIKQSIMRGTNSIMRDLEYFIHENETWASN